MFRKEINISKSSFELDHSTSTLFVGSCFSDSIGNKAAHLKFNTTINPSGIIFNPVSIADTLFLDEGLPDEDIYLEDDAWYCWKHGSSFHFTSEQDLRTADQGIKKKLKSFFAEKGKKTVFVTLGTAWGYRLKSSGRIVANCHKAPQRLFEKELIGSKEISNAYEWLIEKYSSDIQWVFTVSPVRHWKDGPRENNVSKGTLHHAIHTLLAKENVHYFPSYEIIIDELRDYRFFKNDFLHPNDLAVDYVWKKFEATFFSDRTQSITKALRKILLTVNHVPSRTNSKAHQSFLQQTLKTIEQFTDQFAIKLDNEVERVKCQLQ